MIAKLVSGAFDYDGKRASILRKGYRIKPTYPMTSYLTQPLTVQCQSFAEIRDFICQCQYVSDEDQYNRLDYWSPPEEFEIIKKGDCDCFALWVWRQLIDLGYEARFVLGRVGDASAGHAWVVFREKGEWYLLKPFWGLLSLDMPRLKTLLYQPLVSIGWDGEKPQFYEHEETSFSVSMREYLTLWTESILYRAKHLLKHLHLRRRLKEFRPQQPRNPKRRRKR